MEIDQRRDLENKFSELNLRMDAGRTEEAMREFSKICESSGCMPEGEDFTEPLPPPKTLDDLIKGLHIIFSRDEVNVELVKAYMGLYKSNFKEWRKFAIFDRYR